MASKKEIKEYTKIKLDEMKKKRLSAKGLEFYTDKHIEDKFLKLIFEKLVSKSWRDVPSIYIIESEEIEEVTPASIKVALSHMNDDIIEIYNKNKEIENYNRKIDDRYESFCTEMLLIGNGQLADFAKAFIESLTEVK